MKVWWCLSAPAAHHNGYGRSSLLAAAEGEVTQSRANASGGVESPKAPTANINTHDEYGMGLHLMPKRAHSPTAGDCWKIQLL